MSKRARNEVPEYIGFRMSKNKWIEVLKPRDDTYKWINGGASGYAYVNKNKIVKIIRGSKYINKEDFIKEAEKEIDFQERAAKHKLAPKIFYKGFVNEPFFIEDVPYYYYVVMKYLSPDKWVNLWRGQNDKLMCKFISDLVDKVGIINDFDPTAHIYINKNKVVMIDYGRCIECKEEKCKKKMAKTLEVVCGRKKSLSPVTYKNKSSSPKSPSSHSSYNSYNSYISRSPKSPKSPKSHRSPKSPKSHRSYTRKHSSNMND